MAAPVEEVFRPLLRSRMFERLLEASRGESPALTVAGLTESSKALFLTFLRRETGKPILVVTPDDRSFEEWRRDLSAYSRIVDPEGNLGRVARFPALDADPYLGIPPHFQSACERVVTLRRIASREVSFVVAPVRALINPLPTADRLSQESVVVRAGGKIDLEPFLLRLVEQGYRNVDVVSTAGEWARRGGIIDLFPPSEESPIRIELSGDDIESIRGFDPDSQRSIAPVHEVIITPISEVTMNAAARERLARAATLRATARFAGTGDDSAAELAGDRWRALLSGESFQGIEGCAGLALDSVADLFDHLKAAGEWICALDEPDRTDEELDAAYAELTHSREQTAGPLPKPEELFLDPRRIRTGLANSRLRLAELKVGEAQDDVGVLCQPTRNFAGRVPDWRRDVQRHREEGRRPVLLLNTPGTLERTAEVLSEGGIPHVVAGTGSDATGTVEPSLTAGGIEPVFLMLGHLNHGFVLPEIGLALYAEREIYGEEPRPQTRRKRRGAAFVSDFRDLRVGDSVVHVDHGIGRYEGLHRMGGGAAHRDFMLITYEGGGRLFVPVDRLDLVQKYGVGTGGPSPKLDRLGGTGWERRRSRVKKAVEEMTAELLLLYAKRKAIPGRAFAPDSPFQREFEDAFPYVLTGDQEKAIAEVKTDMESDRAMERLLCGDVGFGKTEVAMRAAFKAVQDGCQVAILAPTTVLAFQHLNTFRERFAAFPVNIDMVSRFRTPAEQREILSRVATGLVDILIGTHRLLSKDVEFQRLGLLVVDEEQRFGVAHKERLKKMTEGIDVLVLSATPIPRTLQMSLAGVRDMSLIETPPQNRLAIQTNLVPYKRGIIAAAIRNEMRRGGQVFFVHNRVETLPMFAARIVELVPEARVAIAHGQMDRSELEEVILGFLQGNFDVLCSTTIIENGIDMPRVNTLVVNRADRFGLAQLYQLRGRIGRSDVRAYAYFIIPGRGALSPIARRRLVALQEFSELGSGFRLAAMDLEIRGAGELLGPRQHGHIESLGFDLYVQMLERAVQQMQGEPVRHETPAQINLGVDIRIPESYVPEPGLRLAFYKRVSIAEDEQELGQIRAELVDRFGRLPATGDKLFQLAGLRLLAMHAGVKSIDWERVEKPVAGARIALQFSEPPKLSPETIVRYLQKVPLAVLTPSGVLRSPVDLTASGQDAGVLRIDASRRVLERLLEEQEQDARVSRPSPG